MEAFSDKDTTTEILSRLPFKSLVAFKCTAKRWYNFVSDPFFLRIYHENRVKGFVVQDLLAKLKPVNLLTETGYTLNNNVLDFLPAKKVFLLSSSNGILCCRSWPTRKGGLNVYICNPITRQWVQVRYNCGYDVISKYVGIAFYPFSSSSGANSVFKLVIAKSYKSDPFTYSFDIYSSETNNWKSSKEVCTSRYPISNYTIIFTNGWLHWKTYQKRIIAFHVEKELCKVIKIRKGTLFNCLGESENYLHYVFNNKTDIQVWVLKDYEESIWELKYSLKLPEFTYELWMPVTFYDNVLYISREDKTVTSYDFRTKNFAIVRQNLTFPLLFPYCASLVPLHEPVSFKVGRSERIRKRKLEE